MKYCTKYNQNFSALTLLSSNQPGKIFIKNESACIAFLLYGTYILISYLHILKFLPVHILLFSCSFFIFCMCYLFMTSLFTFFLYLPSYCLTYTFFIYLDSFRSYLYFISLSSFHNYFLFYFII